MRWMTSWARSLLFSTYGTLATMKRTQWWLAALCMVLASVGACTGIAADGSRPLVRRTPEPAPVASAISGESLAALSTLEQLDLLSPPQRDLRRLAQELDPSLGDIPMTAMDERPNYTIGHQEPFWVRNASTNRVSEISATLIYSTPVVYIWVQSGQEYDQDTLRRSADRFSSITYPNVVNTFGSEWHPGVDNDPRLHILYNTVMGDGIAGYFSGVDEYTRPVAPFSNQKEMFYINLAAINALRSYAGHDTTLAHELQHMIHWHMDRGEELWLNEGLSEYAQAVADFSVGASFSNAFAANPDLQLTTWGTTGSNRAHYGGAYLFVTYLAQRFGSEAIADLVAAPANGMASVSTVLRLAGAELDAEDLFADWVIANYADQPGALVEDSRYGYTALNLPPPALAGRHDRYPVPAQVATVANYATDYIELSGAGDALFAFQGAAETQLTDAAVAIDKKVWWANRADDADARLSAQYDLRSITTGTPLTLTASMWWEIESDYDFGYVMVSTDGEHWRILSGQHTDSANPSGNAFGPGYTGRSDAGPDSRSDGASSWVGESFDLSEFAGGQLWLQLRYITDDGVNAAGWLVDNVQLTGPDGVINAAGAQGSEERGWQSEGWLLTNQRLPQRWLLQVMEFEGETLAAVRNVPVNEQGRAEVEVAGLGNGRRAVVAVSGLSPVTTLAAQYEYSIQIKE